MVTKVSKKECKGVYIPDYSKNDIPNSVPKMPPKQIITAKEKEPQLLESKQMKLSLFPQEILLPPQI